MHADAVVYRAGKGAGAGVTDADPITTEVIRNGLNSAANQMKRALIRTSFSPVIYEVLDFAVAIYDRLYGDYNRASAIPSFVVETNYETQNLYSAPHLTNGHDVRAQYYWSYLSGATGHVYGDQPVNHFESDWQTGSAMTWKQRGVTIADDGQRVVEADPFTRLSYTWHAFTPEWAQALDVDEERRARLAAERRSKVTFEIDPIDAEQVKLTVIHDDLEPGGVLKDMISGGWPRVIANLKTLLETGEPLPDTARR